MRFRLYREYGALNSRPVFDAFEQGLKSLGHEIVNTSDGIPVIWSVLWNGRMTHNEKIYQTQQPIVIIEVGNLHRGKTWRVSLNHINSLGRIRRVLIVRRYVPSANKNAASTLDGLTAFKK
jgi:hypothetical protein